MNYVVGAVLLSCFTSPHHMGMGMGMGIGMRVGVEENDTYVLDTNYNTNITENSGERDSEGGNGDNFNMALGFGASFGIIGFIISVLALREKKNREYNDDIYLEPVSQENDSHVLVVNENYNDAGSTGSTGSTGSVGEQQYETICDTLYELAGEKTVH
tara:strand:- start:313 stop:786 length:474 start_codon:yes stop_codon:yes gene_type:complete